MTITKNENKLLRLFKGSNTLQFDNVKHKMSIHEFDTTAWSLNNKEYVNAAFNEQKHCVHVTINLKGKALLIENPKARNPFLTEKRKWIIGSIMIPIILFILGYIYKNH